jgi:type I restriction enzyme R subunit
MKFNEAQLEQAITELLAEQGYPHTNGKTLKRELSEVLIKEDLQNFLEQKYAKQHISKEEVSLIIRQLEQLPSSDLYGSNKTIMNWVRDGQLLKREDRSKKDLLLELIDYETPSNNIFRFVTQLEIEQYHKRIPDGILYINGLPLVVFEFKSAIREEATLHEAYKQITERYDRDIPELFKYNAFCVISDGVNNKAGSFFAAYEYFYTWRAASDREAFQQGTEAIGINSLYSLIKGMFNKESLIAIFHHFIYIPDRSKNNQKIVCRYPQYYAVNKLYKNILNHQRPTGDGKGGTYFGATGCGKSYTMLFLTRRLMKSLALGSPTIIIITDRTDLDDQLSDEFVKAKEFIGDNEIVSVESRADLRAKLKGKMSGGVFLTTIHKFNEDAQLLTDRNNVICISDEAHRSQINLDQKIKVTKDGVKKTYGFAKYLHDSLPNATFVGFTGTPVDATLDVFGPVVDAYTMTESVKDGITRKIVYEGRAAKILIEQKQLEEIETYYEQCVAEGAAEYQVEASKKASASMNAIIGDPDRLATVAKDFIAHYEQRVEEGATVKGKAMFVCSSREIAYDFYKLLIKERPEWAEIKNNADGEQLSEEEQKKIKPIERVKLIMTRNQDDTKELYAMLGTKDDRKELDRQFKNVKSNFKIAIVVDMWLTGFDVPFLDTMYIDKPLQKHNLIQTISRVNRTYPGKEKGLVVDYIGIKKQMNLALAQYNKVDEQNFEDIQSSVIVVKDHIDLLEKIFHKFDKLAYFIGKPIEQLNTLNQASEFVLQTTDREKRYMGLTKRLKAAYDVCVGSENITQEDRDLIHFYLAIRSIVFKLTKGDAPDAAQMNSNVKEMLKNALQSDGVEEIIKMEDESSEIDLFDDSYIDKINKLKLPHTKIQLLQKLLAKAIEQFKKNNKSKGVDFSRQMKALVDKYNERKDTMVFNSEEFEVIASDLTNLIMNIKDEYSSGDKMGISFEEKSFYDVLSLLMEKYEFDYPEEKLIALAKAIKKIVDDKAKYTDWSKRDDIKAELHVEIILILDEFGYPPVDRDEVYKDILEQAETFKKNRA